MEILKGMVKDAGFPDEECSYVKLDENTLYYFIKDYSLPNGNIIATTNLKEAIGHATYTSLGVINQEGQVLIPFENKTIKPIKDNLLLVEKNIPTTESVVNAFNNKSDPFSAQEFAESAATIKQQMKDIMGFSGEFIFDNQFSECALYTMDGINVANNYFSFIGESNGDYYLATNVVGATIMKFNPNQLMQPDTSMGTSINEQQQTEPTPQAEAPNEETTQEQTVSTEGTNGDSLMPNIDIPIQNTMEQEQPPTVNTAVETNEIVESPDTINSTKEEIPQIPEEAVKLNIAQESEEQENENSSNSEALNGQEEIEEDSLADETGGTDDHKETSGDSIDKDIDEETSENSMDEDIDEDISEDSMDEDIDEDISEDSMDENIDEETSENSMDEDIDEEISEDSMDEDIDEEISEDSMDEDIDEEKDTVNEYDDSENAQEKVEQQESKPYTLTDEDIATPTIKDATNTIRKLLEENRKQRQIIDKQTGEIQALKTNIDILREENFSQEQEVLSLRQEMTDYRTKANNLIRENTKIMGTLSRQNDIMKNLEEQNTTLRNQVAGMHALSNAVAEANVLVQPVESEDSIQTSPYVNSNLDIDSYLNGNYGSNSQKMTYRNFGYLDELDNDQTQDMNENDASFQKRIAA